MGLSWDKATLVQNKPKGQTNQGSFSSNPYQNPQMGSFGGAPQGWGNQNSAMYGWGMGFAPPQSAWQGDAPGRAGQDYSYNPMTGQGGWTNSAGGLQIGGSNPYGSGAVSWTDPHTGMRAINPNSLMSLFGDLGGSGEYSPYQMSEFGGGTITAPSAYGGGDWSSPHDLDAAGVIESYRPMMEENIKRGFADAAARAGRSGMAMSTPYTESLGRVEQLAQDQMNQRALEYGYDATKFDRNQALARQMAQNQEAFGAWQQAGNWDMGAQQGNVSNAMQRWMLENQLGFQGNQYENQWNQQNEQNQYNMLAALLGGLL